MDPTCERVLAGARLTSVGQRVLDARTRDDIRRLAYETHQLLQALEHLANLMPEKP